MICFVFRGIWVKYVFIFRNCPISLGFMEAVMFCVWNVLIVLFYPIRGNTVPRTFDNVLFCFSPPFNDSEIDMWIHSFKEIPDLCVVLCVNYLVDFYSMQCGSNIVGLRKSINGIFLVLLNVLKWGNCQGSLNDVG